MSRFVNPVPQFYLNDGELASAGKLYFYETGTTTKKDTYSDFEQTIRNTNPVILSGEGRCPSIFGNGRYTVVFKSSDDIEQWTRDNVELSTELGQYADWSAILTYRINDIVRGPDGEYYRSITSTNTGNNPETSAANWEQIAFLSYWNTNVSYGEDDIVIYNGNMYRSGTDSNLGNDPENSSTDVWKNTSEPSEWVSTISYQTNDQVTYNGAIYRSASDDNGGNTPGGGSGNWVDLSGNPTIVELTGSSTTITSNYDGSYYWSNSGGHTIEIGQESSDEGATVTRLICRSDSSSNLTISLASGVTANWSFDESFSADGYEIKPGEIIELVKVGTNSYVAYAPNGISEIIALNGQYDSSATVTATRIGGNVTVTSNGTRLDHELRSQVNSATGAVPSIFAPDSGSKGNIFYMDFDFIARVSVGSSGQVTIFYQDWSGSSFDRTTTTVGITISYIKNT